MDQKKADIHGLVMVFRMIRGSLGYFAKKYGLSVTEMGIVFDTFFHETMTVTDLAQSQGMPKSTVSRLVDHLVKRGILNRVRPEDNRRIVHVTITEDFRKEMDTLRDDRSFQELLERDLPGERGRLAIQKLGELLELLEEPDQNEGAM